MDLMNNSKDKKTDCRCKDDKGQQSEKGPPSDRSKGLAPAVPPVLKNVGKLAAGVAGMASGSATEKKVDYSNNKMNKMSANDGACGVMVNKSKKISTCIEYGVTDTNQHETKLQNKEPLIHNYYTEDIEEEKNRCYFTRKEKSNKQKVMFQGNNICSEKRATYNKTCPAINSNTQIKCNETNYYPNNSPTQCPQVALNNKKFECNRLRYEDIINKEDIVYSCDYYDFNNLSIKNNMSAAIKSTPYTSNNFDLFGTPKTFIDGKNYFYKSEQSPNQSKDLYKHEAGTSGINNTKTVSNNTDDNSKKNNLFYGDENLNKNTEFYGNENSNKNTVIYEEENLNKNTVSDGNQNSYKNTVFYGDENLNKNTEFYGNENSNKNTVIYEEKKSNKNTVSDVNQNFLKNAVFYGDENLNKNTEFYGNENSNEKTVIYEEENLNKNTVSDGNQNSFKDTRSYQNSYKSTPNGYLETKDVPKVQIDTSGIYLTEKTISFSSNIDIIGSVNNNEKTNRNTTNDNLEHKFEMDKPEMSSTNNAQLVSNTVDLFATSNKFVDFAENNNLSNKKKFNETEIYNYLNQETNVPKGYIESTKSLPTFSNNIDLFGMKNKDKSKQGQIDLFENRNSGKALNESNQNQNLLSSNDANLQVPINMAKSSPIASLNSDLVNLSDTYTYENEDNFIQNIMYDNLDDDLPDYTYLIDLTALPEIGKDTKSNRFFINKRAIGTNNCACSKWIEKNDDGIPLNKCKVYTTMLGINACSHVGGNPRNKTALQPGHSLMDWIRLSHSGQDLTGVGPRAGTLSVSPKQLAEHNTENDAWIAIRGKVYNVSAYFDFHPGGKEELMKGVGQDATQMFNAVHPWVNYESILQKCLVGRLTSLELEDDSYSLFYGRSNQTIQVPKNYRFLTPLVPNTNGELVTESVSSPKFDWLQQLDYITTIFYTKPLSNPQVQVTAPTKENKLEIILNYNNHIFNNHLHFSNNIHWPCKVIINWDTGKVEVNFRKIVSKIWDNYGTLTQDSEKVTEDYEYEKIKYIVLNNVKENHNTNLIAFQRIDGVKQTIPIGYHVKVYGTINDQELIRCYTPVPCSFMRKYSQDYEAYRGDVCLLIKSYPEGLLSPTICNSVKGDLFEFSPPLGSFSMDKIASRSGYLLLAAGSGITPMLGMIKFILESSQLKCEKMYLLYFNRTEEDILLRFHFDTLVKLDERVKVKHILSHPSENWTGLTGHIDANLLKTSIDEQCTNTQLFPVDIFSLICGPLVFTNLAKSLLIDIGYTDDNIHVFGS